MRPLSEHEDHQGDRQGRGKPRVRGESDASQRTDHPRLSNPPSTGEFRHAAKKAARIKQFRSNRGEAAETKLKPECAADRDVVGAGAVLIVRGAVAGVLKPSVADLAIERDAGRELV